jgi:hypothetical protein
MTGKDTKPDVQPKWLRPIDPLIAASLPIRIDPRLGVGHDTADRLQRDAEPLLTVVTVFVTSSYDNVLAAEVTDDPEDGLHVLVRAATGDEAAYLLRPADAEGRDHPESAGRDITWQVTQDSEHMTEPAVVLWSGEVLLKTGKGTSGPFYMHQLAAAAWAFSSALGIAREEVFSAQLVRWLSYAAASRCAAPGHPPSPGKRHPSSRPWIPGTIAQRMRSQALYPRSRSRSRRSGPRAPRTASSPIDRTRNSRRAKRPFG